MITKSVDRPISQTINANVMKDPGLEKLNLQPGKRVLILGCYGVSNVGDEAVLSGLLRSLPPDLRLQVVSRNPGETVALHDVAAVSPLKSLAALMLCDVLIVGGGGIFSGHMGPMGRLIPFFSLIARARGKPVAFYGIGVYPSTPHGVQRMIKRLAPRLTAFAVRDSISAHTLRSWGVEARQIPDLSTYMPPASPDIGADIIRSLGLDPAKQTVALCLTSTERGNEAYLLKEIPLMINAMTEVQFCFIPMSRHPKVPHHNDLFLARRIQARASRLAILQATYHPSEILSLFHYFDAAVCMRYHSLLFAQRSGTAIIPIAYAEKCESWLEDNGIPNTALTDGAIEIRLREALANKSGKREQL